MIDPRSFHLAQELTILLKQPLAMSCKMFLTEGRHPSEPEMQRAIMLAHNKGYDVLPPCDNINDRGYCLGHEGDK